MGEFELIQHYFAAHDWPTADANSLPLTIGDDAALLTPPPGQQLAVSTDTLVAGRHFPTTMAAADIGFRSLATSLSDLAAMGATPWCCFLALTLPEYDAAWLAGFSQGMAELARQSHCPLIGGDTTRGPLTITLTVHGLVPIGQALLRTGARPGDAVYVSGYLGDAAGACLRWNDMDESECSLKQAFTRPQPRLALGARLRGKASACIDISDGFSADLNHLLNASAVGATLAAEALPLSPALRAAFDHAEAERLALCGGDDYELCFTMHPEQEAALLQQATTHGLVVSKVGLIEAEPGLRLARQGQIQPLPAQGYRHFDGA